MVLVHRQAERAKGAKIACSHQAVQTSLVDMHQLGYTEPVAFGAAQGAILSSLADEDADVYKLLFRSLVSLPRNIMALLPLPVISLLAAEVWLDQIFFTQNKHFLNFVCPKIYFLFSG